MKKGWIIALISVTAVAGAYLYYRSQKKAKPIISIPAVAPTPSWLEALKGLVSPIPAVTEAVSVAPTYQVPAPKYSYTPVSQELLPLEVRRLFRDVPEPKYSYTPVPAQEIPLDVTRLFRE